MRLREEKLCRYITPLREGGSLPALAEAEDGFKYVVKFRGAGHGTKALIAELIGGMVAHALGFNVPELVFLDLDQKFGITEGDEEIQDLLKGSVGRNIGLHFLSGAFTFDASVNDIDPATAAKIVWLDAFLTNVDRTTLNTNMLVWDRKLWLIDHGASLMFHHAWSDPMKAALSPFPYIKNHALLRKAPSIVEIDKLMRQKITPRTLSHIVDLIPDEWLHREGEDLTPNQIRDSYKLFLTERLKNSIISAQYADDTRKSLV